MLKNKKIGFGITGSFCSLKKVFMILEELKNRQVDLYIFISDQIAMQDTRFYHHEQLLKDLQGYSEHPLIQNVVEAEMFGPKTPLDLMIIYPCSGNTLAKVAHGINDNAVTMAIKSTLRNQRNIVLGVCSNDVLSSSGMNLMNVLNRKHFYLVPMYQDDIVHKPWSMVSEESLIIQTIVNAFHDVQLQPLFIQK